MSAPASRTSMLRHQTAMELRLSLRNGEQVLLTLLIPVLILVFATSTRAKDAISFGNSYRNVDFLVPGLIALGIMSVAFTSQAIATGFERRYAVLKRLGATPLPRSVLLGAKTLGVVGIEIIQVVLLSVVGLALGWSPHGNPLLVLPLVVLATAAFSGLGLLMAGTLRAEVTLAGANAIYLVLLFLGGVVFPLGDFPRGLELVGEALPSAALSHGLRAVLQHGSGIPAADVVVLAVWSVLALTAAARLFRWE